MVMYVAAGCVILRDVCASVWVLRCTCICVGIAMYAHLCRYCEWRMCVEHVNVCLRVHTTRYADDGVVKSQGVFATGGGGRGRHFD
jgi:hypothetical protein